MRIVAHLDMDAFFASVEEKLNPHLAGKPLVVGGDRTRRGVVSAANYPARAFGIHAGMPIATAVLLCPEATFLEGDPKKYVHVSLQVLDSLKEFTPIIEPFSIDEAFLDLTGAPRMVEALRAGNVDSRDPAAVLNAAGDLARAMQRTVWRRVGLSATIGLATNKYIAKMGSGLKKPRGLTALTHEMYREIFWPRPVQELWGIGEKTAESLGKLGIRTAGQLAKFPREFLTYHFGMNGDRMRDAAWGEDDSPVIPYYEGVPVKSMGHEFTLDKDLADRERIAAHLLRLSDQVGRRMRQDDYLGRVVSVKFRDQAFKTTIRQRALPELTDDETQIHKVATALFEENWDGKSIRLIGVSMSSLVSGAGKQRELFDADQHRRNMTEAVDSLRDKFGDEVLVRAGRSNGVVMSEGGVERPSRPRIMIGTSGYSFPDWVGPFYPPGIERSKMLDFYAREFPVVEVNATYYRIPPPATLLAMERKTPPEFEFVVKTHHDTTHLRSLDPALYQAFARAVEPLIAAGKLHGLIAQFPYSFHRTQENEHFLSALKSRLPDVPLFVEFRHRSWAEESVWERLDAEGIGYVSVDEPDLPGLVPPIARVTGPARIGYVRLHGRNKENWWRNPERGRPDRGDGSRGSSSGSAEAGRRAAAPVTAAEYGPLFAAVAPPAPGPSGASSDRYDYLYSEAELKEWVGKIREMATKAKKTFVFFNNCHVGQAATGAKLMRRLLEGEGLL